MFLNGIVPIYKKSGVVSFDIVRKIRYMLSEKYKKKIKVGHIGTLDPLASGVLVICIGHATRLSEYYLAMPKKYLGSMLLGFSTDTDDITGKVLTCAKPYLLTPFQLEKAFKELEGKIMQQPPIFSAIKVKGVPLYKSARKGKKVLVPKRQVYIYKATVFNYIPYPVPQINFELSCSKGTYIRSFCRDIGLKLSLPACMSSLVRVKSCGFSLKECVTLKDFTLLLQEDKLTKILVPLGERLPLATFIVKDAALKYLLDGKAITLTKEKSYLNGENVKVFTESGRFCGIYKYLEDKCVLLPSKVFREI